MTFVVSAKILDHTVSSKSSFFPPVHQIIRTDVRRLNKTKGNICDQGGSSCAMIIASDANVLQSVGSSPMTFEDKELSKLQKGSKIGNSLNVYLESGCRLWTASSFWSVAIALEYWSLRFGTDLWFTIWRKVTPTAISEASSFMARRASNTWMSSALHNRSQFLCFRPRQEAVKKRLVMIRNFCEVSPF